MRKKRTLVAMLATTLALTAIPGIVSAAETITDDLVAMGKKSMSGVVYPTQIDKTGTITMAGQKQVSNIPSPVADATPFNRHVYVGAFENGKINLAGDNNSSYNLDSVIAIHGGDVTITGKDLTTNLIYASRQAYGPIPSDYEKIGGKITIKMTGDVKLFNDDYRGKVYDYHNKSNQYYKRGGIIINRESSFDLEANSIDGRYMNFNLFEKDGKLGEIKIKAETLNLNKKNFATAVGLKASFANVKIDVPNITIGGYDKDTASTDVESPLVANNESSIIFSDRLENLFVAKNITAYAGSIIAGTAKENITAAGFVASGNDIHEGEEPRYSTINFKAPTIKGKFLDKHALQATDTGRIYLEANEIEFSKDLELPHLATTNVGADGILALKSNYLTLEGRLLLDGKRDKLATFDISGYGINKGTAHIGNEIAAENAIINIHDLQDVDLPSFALGAILGGAVSPDETRGNMHLNVNNVKNFFWSTDSLWFTDKNKKTYSPAIGHFLYMSYADENANDQRCITINAQNATLDGVVGLIGVGKTADSANSLEINSNQATLYRLYLDEGASANLQAKDLTFTTEMAAINSAATLTAKNLTVLGNDYYKSTVNDNYSDNSDYIPRDKKGYLSTSGKNGKLAINIVADGHLEAGLSDLKGATVPNAVTGDLYQKDTTGAITLNLGKDASWHTNLNSSLRALNLEGGLLDLRTTNAKAPQLPANIYINEVRGQGSLIVNNTPDTSNKLTINQGKGEIAVFVGSTTTLPQLPADKIHVATNNAQDVKFVGGTYEGKNTVKLYQTTLAQEDNDWFATGLQYKGISNNGAALITSSQASRDLWQELTLNQTLSKRLGDIRENEENSGMWLKYANSKHSRKGDYNYTSKNSTTAFGLDKIIKEKDHTYLFGIAGELNSGTANFASGSSDPKAYGLMLYASSINKDRSYLDLVLRTDRLSTSSKTYGALSDSSDFSTRGYSASLEYGKKFTLSNPEVYFQPEIQLAYGHLAAKDYTSANGISAKLDASNSLLGRIGFKLGKYFDQHRNNVYLKGSLLHYFQGDQQIGLNSGAADSFQYTSSAKGTSYLVGAGFDVDFTDNSRFYGEVEKSFGGDLKTDWAFQLGLKFMF